jgi:hypothetical protein
MLYLWVLSIRRLNFNCILTLSLAVIPKENLAKSATSELGAHFKLVFVANG